MADQQMHGTRSVSIKQINGNVTSLTVDPDVSIIWLTICQISISEFKNLVSEKTGIAVSEMRLIFKAKQLVDSSKLSEYGKKTNT